MDPIALKTAIVEEVKKLLQRWNPLLTLSGSLSLRKKGAKMAGKGTDQVISYTVHSSGKLTGYEELQEALVEGYRVVDVLPTPTTVGGGGSGFGAVVVTVILTETSEVRSSAYRRKDK